MRRYSYKLLGFATGIALLAGACAQADQEAERDNAREEDAPQTTVSTPEESAGPPGVRFESWVVSSQPDAQYLTIIPISTHGHTYFVTASSTRGAAVLTYMGCNGCPFTWQTPFGPYSIDITYKNQSYNPWFLAADEDNDLWFVGYQNGQPTNVVGQVTNLVHENISYYTFSAPVVSHGMLVWPDKGVWGILQNNKIGTVTDDGKVQEFALPAGILSSDLNSYPALGPPDKQKSSPNWIWLVAPAKNTVVTISKNGVMNTIPYSAPATLTSDAPSLPEASAEEQEAELHARAAAHGQASVLQAEATNKFQPTPAGVTWTVADKYSYLTPCMTGVDYLLRIDFSGNVTTFAAPGTACTLTADPQNNVWFGMSDRAILGQVTPGQASGPARQIPLSAGGNARYPIYDIDTAQVWFGSQQANVISSVDENGEVTARPVASGPRYLDGDLKGVWFGEPYATPPEIGEVKANSVYQNNSSSTGTIWYIDNAGGCIWFVGKTNAITRGCPTLFNDK